MSDRSFLRFAFLARNAVAADGGVNIANAFMTATAVPTFTAWDRVTVVGEYQFARLEQAKAHTFEVECFPPAGASPVQFQAPQGVLPPYTFQLVGGDLTGHLFSLPVLIEVQEPGRHTIAVTLDGAQITRLPLDVFLGAGPPDDDPRRLTEG
jgi:hypothetical protein